MKQEIIFMVVLIAAALTLTFTGCAEEGDDLGGPSAPTDSIKDGGTDDDDEDYMIDDDDASDDDDSGDDADEYLSARHRGIQTARLENRRHAARSQCDFRSAVHHVRFHRNDSDVS